MFDHFSRAFLSGVRVRVGYEKKKKDGGMHMCGLTRDRLQSHNIYIPSSDRADLQNLESRFPAFSFCFVMGLCSSNKRRVALEYETDASSSLGILQKQQMIDGFLEPKKLDEHEEEARDRKVSLLKTKIPISLTGGETIKLVKLFNHYSLGSSLDKMAFLRIFMREGTGLFGSDTSKAKRTNDNVERIFELFSQADTNGDARLSLQEFLSAVSLWKRSRSFAPRDRLKLYFDLFDSEGNGKLSKESFSLAMRNMLTIHNRGEMEEKYQDEYNEE